MARMVVWLVLTSVLAMPAWTLAEAQVQGAPRVRGSSPAIAEAIELAFDRSPTFRDLVAAISRTDGIVYVHHGQCGRNVLACVLLTVTQAGPNRILHIRIDPRRKGDDLMVSIGHELTHAVELLREPGVVDSNTAHNFYQRTAAIERYNFETQAAIEIELKLDKDLRKWAKRRESSGWAVCRHQSHTVIEPRARTLPLARHGRSRHRQRFGNFLFGQAAEIPELHDSALPLVHRRKLGQGFVERQDVLRLIRRGNLFIEIHPPCRIGTFGGPALARMIDEDAPHHLGGNGIEVSAILPCDAVLAGESQKRFMDECSGLQSVIRPFVPQVTSGSLSQFVIHERDERIACLEIAACPGAQ